MIELAWSASIKEPTKNPSSSLQSKHTLTREMKSMINDDDNTENNTQWLGMKMEVSSGPNHCNQTGSSSPSIPTTAIPTTFFHSPPHLSYGICYGVEGENGGLYSPFPGIPLKSDGSLCIMEPLARSQPQATTVTSSTPKLEDFFGGATMGTHHYAGYGRVVMPLSLHSMYYEQLPDNELNNQNCLTHLQQSSRQQQEHQQIQAQLQYPYYSSLRSHELLLGEEGKETQVPNYACHLQLPTMGDENGVKNQVSRTYPTHRATDQKLTGCMGDNGIESGSIGEMSYGDLQSLSLSMSPGSQSSCVTGSQKITPTVAYCATAMENKKRGPEKMDQKHIVHRKSIDTFGQRTSQYRGVTRHRWTGRYEAHLWDNSCKKEGQSRKGKQVYLGGYDVEEKAARAYDLAALKYWGPSTHINFPLENYQKEVEAMKNMTRQEYVAHLRRKSSGFSRGASMYRGVTRHHQHGRWQARIGRVAGNKDLYLGTFSTQEEAAEAYDIAAIKFRGANAVTNFEITRYDVERIMTSNTLLAGDVARRHEDIGSSNDTPIQELPSHDAHGEANPLQKSNVCESDWKMVLCQPSQQPDHRDYSAYVIGNYKTQDFSLAQENVMGIDVMSAVCQPDFEESVKMGTHLSNASSLVTSLSSSREGSPDRASLPMLLAMPPSAASKLYTSPSSNVNSWVSSNQLRPSASLPHMSLLAAWTDA